MRPRSVGRIAFRDTHASLAALSLRELDFLAGIIECRIERLVEVEGDGEGDEAEAELSLAA